MHLLLTGASGFIGQNLLPGLKAAGHSVDCCGRNDSPEEFDQVRYDAVVHLGWEGVAAKDRNDWAMQTRNVSRFGRLLAMCEFWKPSVFVGFGSQAEYGKYANREHCSTEELEAALTPQCAYGWAKSTCYSMLESFYSQLPTHNLRALWLRLFSVYGPGEGEHWLIPSTLRRLRQQDPLEFTPGEQEMDYLHVSDVCAAVLAALENETLSGTYDLAPGAPGKVRTVIETLAELTGFPKAKLRFGALPYRPGQLMRACANPKFWRDSGLKPQVSLLAGLRDLVGRSSAAAQKNQI